MLKLIEYYLNLGSIDECETETFIEILTLLHIIEMMLYQMKIDLKQLHCKFCIQRFYYITQQWAVQIQFA